MDETFLHFLWEHAFVFPDGLLDTPDFQGTIEDRGMLNRSSGPDFWQVKIRTDQLLLVGNLEVHVRSDDWYTHEHHLDPAYNNVILHLVWQSGCKDVYDSEGRKIPTLSLPIAPSYWELYRQYKESARTFSCQQDMPLLDTLWLSLNLPSYTLGRIMRKSDEMQAVLQGCMDDYEQAFYTVLARSFGLKNNVLPFAMLAGSLSLNQLRRQASSPQDVEAMLFGQSGLLLTAGDAMTQDDYVCNLTQRYVHLQRKYALKPIDPHLWKYGGLRPFNFPDVRIAQFAALVLSEESRLSRVLENLSVDYLLRVFQVSAGAYWDTHYRIGKESAKKQEKKFGLSSVHNLIINAIVPFVMVYAERKADGKLREQVMTLLEALPAEQNHIVRSWMQAGVTPQNALESQALIELYNNFCQPKKCLDCTIGHKLFLVRCEALCQ